MRLFGEPWDYWLLILFALFLILLPWLCSRWERMQDERDREAWKRIPGSR